MKKILIVSNTYYQLIFALKLKLSLFKEDYVTLILSDHSLNADSVAKRLKELHFFDEVRYIESKNKIKERTQFDKLQELYELVFSSTNRYQYFLSKNDLFYDEVLYFNYGIDIYGLFSILSTYNKNIVFSGYEEGVLSYNNSYRSREDSAKFKLIRLLRKFIGKRNLHDNLGNFYCFYPQLYKGPLQAIEVPELNMQDCELQKVLKYIFNLQPSNTYSNIKYIFFETSYESDGLPIGESELILKIANLVGKENLLVKKHPRSQVTVYEKNGLNVDVNSTIPFEVIQLSCDFSHCTFLTTISGSVLSVNAVAKNPVRTFLLYPLVDYKKYDSISNYVNSSLKTIEALQKNGKLSALHIATNLDVVKMNNKKQD